LERAAGSSLEEAARLGKDSSGSDPESGTTGLNARFSPAVWRRTEALMMVSLGSMPVFVVFKPQTSPETNAPNATIKFGANVNCKNLPWVSDA
jgi:hypothetical protein